MSQEISTESIDSRYSFWRLINEYDITIPLMQRDYAQGRKNENVESIRGELLESIYSALMNEENLDFDFVYGSLTEHGLCPLDGQQRLTTLFLLYWYIASKEGRLADIRPVLKKFSYETRISSREFCKRLVEMDYRPSENETPSEFIKNQYCYFRVWDKDPTISAMLVMLNAIHGRFFDVKKELFPLLTRSMDDDPIITFSYLPMENYALTDDLYIKMNSRGKNLSDFENFKAKFLQHLKKNNLPFEHFEKSIDKAWTDLFWDYRSDWDNTFDEEFMNVFTYFTEMINLEDYGVQEGRSPFSPSRLRGLIDFYDSAEKVEKLYELLDLWKNKKEVDECISKTFSDTYEQGKVRIFDTSSNLFESVVKGQSIREYNKVVLYAFMKRLIYHEKNDLIDLNLSEYVRVIRNLVMKVRQRKNHSYISDFRYGRHGGIYVRFALNEKLMESDNIYATLMDVEDETINSENLKYEKDKADLITSDWSIYDTIYHLEDLDVFQTCIQNIMPYIRSSKKTLKDLPKDIELLFKQQFYNKIVRAMLSIGDYGIYLRTSRYGDICYYGNKKTNWHTILTLTGEKEYPAFISEFLNQYFSVESEDVEGRLDLIISKNIGNYSKNDWKYYFLKYPALLDNSDGVFSDRIIILKEKKEDTIIPHFLNGVRLTAFHACAYYIEAQKQIRSRHNILLNVEKEKTAERLGRIVFNSGAEVGITAQDKVQVYYDEGETSEKIAENADEYYKKTSNEQMDDIENIVIMCEAVINAEKELL